MDNTAGALTKINRKKALRILTQDIPTLEVNYDARVLVITEDENDAKLWEELYSRFARRRDFDRPLVFLGSGVKTEHGTVGAGCDRVKKIVEKMREATLPRVIGLVDWDGKKNSKPDQKIHVLCEGERYAVENLLLDPVLCFYFMCRKHRDVAEKFNYLSPNESDRKLDDFDIDRWQEMIIKFCSAVLKDEDISETINIRYACGKSLLIPKTYLQKKGHDLQDAIIKAYPCFKSFDGKGGVLLEIARALSVGDFGEFYPQSITGTLEALIKLGGDTENDG